MAQIFPEWTNKIPILAALALVVCVLAGTAFIWYFFSPEFTDVGYKPDQPVEYSHKLHAGDLGLDCRYCHVGVERSAVASIPPTQICMNCHNLIKTDSEKLLPVRQSWDTGIPIEWVRVHKVPDFAYFNHSVHLRADIGCASCHGNVAEMDVVRQMEPLSMSWCLDCHRNPDMHIRIEGDVTNMKWTPSENQLAMVANIKENKNIDPPTDCSGCHR